MLTLIGSCAMKQHFPEFREPNDLDFFWSGDPSKVNKTKDDVFADPRLAAWDFGPTATVDELYTIKISHAFWDLHGTWNKHASDIVFLQRHGAQFIRELYDILLPIWKEKHGRKRTNLNQTKAEFFGDAVKRIYDHDSIHASVAYTSGQPMYERILKDGSEVLVDNAKFWAMSEADKFRTVREEIMATALERWLIPNDYKMSPRLAYAKATKLTATSLFKGEWSLFLMLNYDNLRSPDCDYVSRHLKNSDMLIAL